MTASMSIKGLQEAQQWNERAIRNMQPNNAFGDLLKTITSQLHRFEVSITHVDTGALRASERIELDMGRMRSRIYIDESAHNPRTRAQVSNYGAAENARGGSHAFGERTAKDYAPGVITRALSYFGSKLT